MRRLPLALATVAVAVGATLIVPTGASAVTLPTFSPSGWDFGAQSAPDFSSDGVTPIDGAPHQLTLTNSTGSDATLGAAYLASGGPGTTSADNFAITANDCPVSPATLANAASCHITVVARATAAVQQTDTLTVPVGLDTVTAPLSVEGVEDVAFYARPQATSVQLRWHDLAHDPATPITGIQVLRGTTANNVTGLAGTVAPDATDFTDTSVLTGITYYYQLRPLVGAGSAIGQLKQPITPVSAIPWGHGGAGNYYTLSKPTRFLDTRSGQGVAGGSKSRLAPGKTLSLQITGRGSGSDRIPSSGVSAVVVNLVIVSPVGTTSLTAYPAGHGRPAGQSVWGAGSSTVSNTVTVRLGAGGKININNSSAHSTHVLAEVQGYYSTDTSLVASRGDGGQFQPFGTPFRWVDTRDPDSFGQLPSHFFFDFPIPLSDVAAPHVTAAVVSITSINATGSGNLIAYNDNDQHNPSVPSATALSYRKGVTTQNIAVVPVTYHSDSVFDPIDPWIAIDNSSSGASTNILVDVIGFYDDNTLPFGARFSPYFDQTRLADSRAHTGISSDLHAGQTAVLTPSSTVAAPLTESLAMQVVAVAPTANTSLVVWPHFTHPIAAGDGRMQAASAINTTSSLLPVTGDVSNRMNVYNKSGTTSLRIDATGRFDELTTLNEFASTGAGPSVSLTATSTMSNPQLIRLLPQRTAAVGQHAKAIQQNSLAARHD